MAARAVPLYAQRKLFPDAAAYLRPDAVCAVGLVHLPGGAIYVDVPTLANTIWGATNHRKVVRNKAEKAHDSGELYRLPPMASAIYIRIDDLEVYMGRWRHRDPVAGGELAQYDFGDLRRSIYARLESMAREQEGLLQDQIDSRTRQRNQWHGRGDQWRALAARE